MSNDNGITLLTHTVDGKHIGYSSETVFLVQIGKGKSAYSTRYSFRGNLQLAVFWYNGINIGNGYKKRLVSFDLNRPMIARHTS